MRKEMIQYVYNSIELNIQRMITYKNNIRKKKKKEKSKENKYFWRCVLVL